MNELTLKELQRPTTPLAKIYARKLPKYNWAGVKTRTEKEYVRWFRKRHQTTRPLVNNATEN